MRELLAELTAVLDQGRDCVYCSVIETRGSTPQKAGAAMLVFPDGSQRGTLGGGCVEAEVRQRALRSLATGRTEIHTFSLDDDYGWDDGLVCGGRMSILTDPLAADGGECGNARVYYRRYRELIEQGKGCTEAVVMGEPANDLAAGGRFLFDAVGRLAVQTPSLPSQEGQERLPVHEELARLLTPVQQRPRPAVHRGIAFLPFWPRITLLIVGGGHVGQAVARLAAEVDFDVWVLDDREPYAGSDRFPMAHKRLVGGIGATLQELVRTEIDASTFCVIVTRGHAHDEEALYHLAPSRAGYVGMIGSQRKKKLIYEDLRARGIPEELLSLVHSPLGFDIGSQTVPEIAVSIVAELIACRNLGAEKVSGPFSARLVGGKGS